MQRTTPGDFSWVDLQATDLEAQSEFYENVFGWTHYDIPIPDAGFYRMFEMEDARVAGAGAMQPDMKAQGVPSSWNTYIYSEDVDATAARAAELGGQVIMPAMDVMTEGRMVGIMDPSGGVVYFWQPIDHYGSEVFGEPGSIIWNDLNTRDPEGAARFFGDLLGWQVDEPDHDPNYRRVVVNGMPQGGIMEMPPNMPPEVPPHWLTYFTVTDVDEFVDRTVQAGGRAQMEPISIGITSFCVMSDPEGAIFGVMQPVDRG